MYLPLLNLPSYSFKSKLLQGKWYIFDMLRRQYVRLTPEEWVRQHFVRYLIEEKQYPPALIVIEHTFELNGLTLRCDIAVFDNSGKILAIVECKSTDQPIDQQVFDQIFVYNSHLKARYLMLTNGLQHYCCRIDLGASGPIFLKDIPFYAEIR
ncbi:MAG: type I restriction enzyme HsdR N-terminal domain-containing protein [Bacteroidales bacterium]